MSTIIALHPHTGQRAGERGGRSQRPALRLVHPAEPLEPRAEPAAQAWPAEHPLRLTRRGRAMVKIGAVVLALALVAAGVLMLDRSAEAGPAANEVPVAYHVVLPGETLWQIAGEVAPGVDRRDTVDDLIELNALPGASVAVGQEIAYPVQP